MGSEQYPYKGVLDQLANRAFSTGTNAWTDIDHTAYTLSTAGGEGFLRMLPIYIDHILYPTLQLSGYLTEVRSLCLHQAFSEPSSFTRYITLTPKATILVLCIVRCRAVRIHLQT